MSFRLGSSQCGPRLLARFARDSLYRWEIYNPLLETLYSWNAMSTTTATTPGGLESVPVVVIVPSLKILLIVTVFSSFLIPTTIALFVSSTPALRSRPTFILNVCAIAIGLAQGVILIYLQVSKIYILMTF